MNENEEFSKLASIKKCPICGGTLEKGYIGAHEGVTWNSNKRKYLRVMLWRFYYVFLNTPALKCERCGIIIFDYGYDLRTPRSFMKKCVKCRKEIPIASEECPYCKAKQLLKREQLINVTPKQRTT